MAVAADTWAGKCGTYTAAKTGTSTLFGVPRKWRPFPPPMVAVAVFLLTTVCPWRPVAPRGATQGRSHAPRRRPLWLCLQGAAVLWRRQVSFSCCEGWDRVFQGSR